MGAVYKALDKRLNRTVALKFLLPDQSGSPVALSRFRREAESIAALNHPNIAILYEVGEWDGEPFLALEYLPNGSLKQREKRGSLALPEILKYTAELSAALQFAHTQGILHRDIKPGNAMFSAHGVLKLVDFGLAKSAGDLDLTETGASVGTLGYMAPEILRGADASVRSDLYGLGVLVYELAAGRPMYTSKDLGSLVEHVLSGSSVPLSSLRPDLPPAFIEAVRRATAVRPEDRFSSVSEFAAELRKAGSAADAGELSATQTMAAVPQKLGNLGRNRGVRTWVVGGALIAALIIAGIMAWPSGRKAYMSILRSTSSDGQTLVVLPFENLGGDPANQALCDGLQETVTGLLSTALSAKSSWLVVPSSEVRRDHVLTIAEARKQFHADLALTGGVQRDARELHLTMNLADAVRMRQKDSRMISVPLTETASLQGRLLQELGYLLGAGTLVRRDPQQSGETTTNSHAYDLFLQGKGALKNGNYDDAVTLLKKALAADPEFAVARAKLAEAYLRKHTATRDPAWLGLADAEINRASQSGNVPGILFAQALVRKATGDTGTAIRLFRQLLQNDPSDVEYYRFLAETYEAAKRNQEAEATLQEALRLRPGYWPLYNALGLFYMDTRQYDKAAQAYSTGLSIAPEVSTLHYNQGALFFTMDRWQDAERAFARSLEIKPNPIAYSNLGTVLFFQGKYAKSAKQFEAAIKLQPANPVNWGNLGDARWQLPGQRDAAAEAFRQGALLASQQLAINPGNTRLRKVYALYLAKLGRPAEAVAEVKRALAESPSDGGVQFWAARVYAVTGDMESARAALKRCRALGYSAGEITREPDLFAIRQDPRFGADSRR